MKDSVKTLIIDANGPPCWKIVLMDTMLRGSLNLNDESILPGRFLHRVTLARRWLRQRYESVSYKIDWREALCQAPGLDTDICNINNLTEYFRSMWDIRQYPLIIILHSATGDDMSLLSKTADRLNRRRGKVVVFLGNEYSLMAEKIEFIRSIEADYVCSQLPLETARWLYAECSHSQILAMPHALAPMLYCPTAYSQRAIDIGFIGALYHNVIGDMERTNLIRFFEMHGVDYGLTCDIRPHRLPRSEWARFLNVCRGIVGAESGTYYLDRSGRIIEAARAYLKVHPTAPFDEVFDLFFKDCQSPVSGKAISSRHFESIGTKTCQILVEGRYNGILIPDEHYISVRKDLSNIDDVIRRFKDDDYRKAMVERAYEYVMAGHTYRHRVESLLKAVINRGL